MPLVERGTLVRIVLIVIAAWGILSTAAVAIIILSNDPDPDHRAIIKMANGPDPMASMIEVNNLIVDARHLPREIQEEASRKGLIPYIPGDGADVSTDE